MLYTYQYQSYYRLSTQYRDTAEKCPFGDLLMALFIHIILPNDDDDDDDDDNNNNYNKMLSYRRETVLQGAL